MHIVKCSFLVLHYRPFLFLNAMHFYHPLCLHPNSFTFGRVLASNICMYVYIFIFNISSSFRRVPFSLWKKIKMVKCRRIIRWKIFALSPLDPDDTFDEHCGDRSDETFSFGLNYDKRTAINFGIRTFWRQTFHRRTHCQWNDDPMEFRRSYTDSRSNSK